MKKIYMLNNSKAVLSLFSGVKSRTTSIKPALYQVITPMLFVAFGLFGVNESAWAYWTTDRNGNAQADNASIKGYVSNSGSTYYVLDDATERSISPNLFEVMSTNLAKNNNEFRGYEIGIVFNVKLTGDNGLPDEHYNMTIGTYGGDEDFFSLKGMIEELFDRIGVGTLEFEPEVKYGMFHPGRCARFFAKDEDGEDVEIGIMGEIHPDVRENFGIGVRAYSAEIDLETVIQLADRTIEYRKPPVYPSTSRDIALVVDEFVKVGDIEAAIRDADDTILEDVTLFDIYRGDQVPELKKSIAFSLTYRSEEKTLTDEEANEVHDKIVKKLKEEFGASIRD